MAFNPEALNPAIKFTNAHANQVKWIIGKGQWIYWTGCIGVTLYENGGEGQVQSQLSGQVKLEPGFELYLTGGQVKEE
ncbi:hypothetical protein EG329_003751 [Mollisiaceae sp. DMI_Dod_QoI]|nr:hypothetical protein EG329_003751 [Helotiales sp. DMI_Dod_QoI]